MTGMAADPAREQLRELISILGELRNAGPRDQRFKQWRQITTTLMQRIWPGDPTRAELFRRISFSAPTAFPDRQATRDYFERGCREAAAFLHGLVLELGNATAAAAPADEPVVPPPPFAPIQPATATPALPPQPAMPIQPATAAPAPPPQPAIPIQATAAAPAPPPQPAMPIQPATAAPAPPPQPAVPIRAAAGEPPLPPQRPVTPVAPPPTPAIPVPSAPSSPVGPKPRLKDMLGFADEAIPAADPAPPAVPSAPPRPVPTIVPASADPVPGGRAAQVSGAPTPPIDFIAALPPAVRGQSAPPAAPAPSPTTAAVPAPAPRAVPPATSASPAVAASGPGPTRTGASPARALLALASRVEELGVPLRERAVVRAALIDIGRQMESPPVHWQALRELVALAMDHPALARRVLPLVLPYLDRAA